MTASLALELSVAPFPVETALLGPDEVTATAIAGGGDTGALAAVIGPKGSPGPPGEGAEDPGDLTLIFDNKLI